MMREEEIAENNSALQMLLSNSQVEGKENLLFGGLPLHRPEFNFSQEVCFVVDLPLTVPLGHLYQTPAIGLGMNGCSLHFEICADAQTGPSLQADNMNPTRYDFSSPHFLAVEV